MAFSRSKIYLSQINRLTLNHLNGLHTTADLLAGHSKWANIRHIKALKDGQKSAEFTKLARQIRLAVQDGGGSTNPALNSLLRTAVDEALKRNMPNVKIQTILKKCAATASVKLKKMIVELRALNKIFVVCVLYTDNPAASRMAMAPIIRKFGATALDIRHMFIEKGVIVAVPETINESESLKSIKTAEELEEICLEHAIECGAEEVEVIDVESRNVSFNCDVMDLDKVKQKLESKGFRIELAEHVFIPKNTIILSEAELKTYNLFKDKLQAIDGVEDIFDNIENDEDGEIDDT